MAFFVLYANSMCASVYPFLCSKSLFLKGSLGSTRDQNIVSNPPPPNISMRMLILLCELIFDACLYFKRTNWSFWAPSSLKMAQNDQKQRHTPMWPMLMHCRNSADKYLRAYISYIMDIACMRAYINARAYVRGGG